MIETIIQNIADTEISTEPFGYKFIKEIFPKNFYNKLISNLPEINQYVAINKTGSVSQNYPAERFIFDLTLENIKSLKENKEQVLLNVLKVFTSPVFFSSIAEQFRKIIDDRIKNFSKYEIELLGKSNFKFFMRSSLVKDINKYQLGVHTDTIQKFLTFLFYIPKDDQLMDLGTTLYEPKQKISLDEKGSFHSDPNKVNEEFKIIKKIPFLPNSLLLFPRTNNSFHGVEKINIDQKERNLLLLNFYIQTI